MRLDEIVVEGVTYRPAEARQGRRAVVVVDRGWIFAGDVEERDGRVYLARAVWVFNWQQIGFDGVLASPKSEKVSIRPVPGGSVDIPAGSEIFRVPVADTWGL